MPDSNTSKKKIFISVAIIFGVVGSYLGIFYTVIAPAKSLTDAVSNAQRGIASMNRINEILDADNIIHNPKKP